MVRRKNKSRKKLITVVWESSSGDTVHYLKSATASTNPLLSPLCLWCSSLQRENGRHGFFSLLNLSGFVMPPEAKSLGAFIFRPQLPHYENAWVAHENRDPGHSLTEVTVNTNGSSGPVISCLNWWCMDQTWIITQAWPNFLSKITALVQQVL